MDVSHVIGTLEDLRSQHGDIEVHFAGFGNCRDVRQIEVRDMCTEDEVHWRPCEYDLCGLPHKQALLIQ